MAQVKKAKTNRNNNMYSMKKNTNNLLHRKFAKVIILLMAFAFVFAIIAQLVAVVMR